MVAGEVVLGEMVCQIVFYLHPIYREFSLPDSVSEPVKFHVNGYQIFLVDSAIDKYLYYGSVCHYWGGWLGVDHLYERHSRF